MSLLVEIVVDEGVDATHMPEEAVLQSAIQVAADMAGLTGSAECSVTIVAPQTICDLNTEWRDQHKPTNVLAFAADEVPGAVMPPDVPRHLGDIVVCADVVADEASDQGKTPTAHWTHMVVHGVLHLLGYDHNKDSEAEVMESLERRVLDSLGFADPYA